MEARKEGQGNKDRKGKLGEGMKKRNEKLTDPHVVTV